MGDYSPPETSKEKLDRLRLMAQDENATKWDLSENDRAAIAYALKLIERERRKRE